MAKLIRRADIMSALENQLDAYDIYPEPFILPQSIQPVVDISRPSKVPYSDWVAGSSDTDNATLIAARLDKKIVLTHLMVSYAKAAADTGVLAAIVTTVGGASIEVLYAAGVTLTAGAVHIVSDCEMVVDENTRVYASINGTFTNVNVAAFGYYINA